MKIYPGNHKIGVTKEVDYARHIPLYYINYDTEDFLFKIDSSIGGNNELIPLIPYNNSYSMSNVYIDKYKNILNNNDILTRKDNKYYYTPKNIRTFIPDYFEYQILIKKHIKYNSEKIYNINAFCVDNSYLTFSNKLIKAFGNIYKTGVVPSNILINNGNIELTNLINQDIEKSDFILIESLDGIHYYDYENNSNLTEKINIENMLKSNKNVWISVKEYNDLKITKDTIDLSIDTIINTENITTECFDISNINNKNFVNISNKNTSPVLIYHYKNNGYIIISHQSLFDNLQDNIKIFYNILFYIYSVAYKKSEVLNKFITYENIDYICKNEQIYKNQYNSINNIEKYFEGLSPDDFNIVDCYTNNEHVAINNKNTQYLTTNKDVDLSNINFDDNISLKDKESISINIAQNSLYFTKNKITNDILKKPNEISILTSNNNVVIFEDFAYKTNEKLLLNNNATDKNNKIYCSVENNIILITIKPFIFSDLNIFNNKTIILKQELSKIENYKYKENIYKLNIVFNNGFVIKTENEITKKDIIIASLYLIKQNKNVKLYDLRQRAGGIYEKDSNKYSADLFDISNLFGRPYRKNNTLIIKIPKKYEDKKEYIKEAVQKHCCAEDYPIIIFV